MKSLSVYDIKGKVAAEISLDQGYFDGKINKSLLHHVVLGYLANLRKGCASTKTRACVRGGGRKPWRQKGTGRARVGSIRSPLWRGGGVIFGPHPRDYRYRLTKQVKSLALKQSLNGKLKDNELMIIDRIELNYPKTKQLVSLLRAWKAERKSLLVIEKYDTNILRSAANIPQVTVRVFNDINALDVLRHKKIIFSKKALENLVKLRRRS
jgi:large subunit ribosomal protein L4